MKMRIVLRGAAQKQKPNFAKGLCFLVFAAGLALLLKQNFASLGVPAWGLFAGEVVFGGLLAAFGMLRRDTWVFPAAAGLLLALCAVFFADVTAGLASLGNDALDLLTAKTGRIYLDFNGADAQKAPYAAGLFAGICVLLFWQALRRGKFAYALPVLAMCYAVVFVFSMGVATGLLIAGTVLLLVCCVGKNAFAGVPLYLAAMVLCIGAAVGLGYAFGDGLTENTADALRAAIHAMRYDEETNSMPEGQLKNLSAWKKTDTPALRVTMEQPQKIYLRGAVYETYRGTKWEALPAEERAEYEDLFYWLHQAGFYAGSQVGSASRLTTTVRPLSMTVENLSACSAVGYAPYALLESDGLDAGLIGDLKTNAARELTYLAGSVPEWYRVQQTLASAQSRGNIAEYLTQEQAFREYVEAMDLQLTQDSWAVIDRQLEAGEGARTLGEIRALIRTYLQDALVYDEAARTQNGNADFLQYTLEQSGSGYSVHYATAATLMLRYFGVPARYVEGYFLSAEEAASYAAGEEITLTEEHAHAWAEYYLAGVGFVPFEVTPGYMDDEENELGGESEFDEGSYTANPLGFAQVDPPEQINEPEQDRAAFSVTWKHAVGLIILLVLLLVGRVIYGRLRLKKRLRAIDDAAPHNAIAMRYGYACYVLQCTKTDVPAGAEDAAALNAEALFSDHAMTEAARAQMDAYAQAVTEKCRAERSLGKRIKDRLWDFLY